LAQFLLAILLIQQKPFAKFAIMQGWANIFYGGPHWRFYCYRGPHARITYITFI